jgi:DNA repair protein RecN (Recombination protein N)
VAGSADGDSVRRAWYTGLVLHELRVENLLLLERAELRLAPGLNVLTGETGAGKTLLAQALDLLLGGKARAGIVRPGASEAYVEGTFALPDELDPQIAERIPDGADEIVVARRVWPDGRTRAYLCGRSATVGDLRDLGQRVMAFYGQHEHRKLTLSSAQLDVLDWHCDAAELRERVATAYERVRELERRVGELSELAAARERELDLIAFELEEIDAASPSESEERELTTERDRLRHLDVLRSAALGGAEAIAPDGGTGAGELLAGAASALQDAAALDPSLESLAERLEALRYEADDVGGELRRYALGLDGGSPGRLDEVEQRLALFASLKRKHGGSIAEVLTHAERCRARRAELENAEVALEAAQRELTAAGEQLDLVAAELSERRAAAAPELSAAVRERLAALAMPEAHFEVRVLPRADGCGPRGADVVEFEIATNPGVPAGPVREIASGGELSRVMLALLSAAHDGGERSPGEQPVLVFDEIDAGVGGHTARAVGEHLRDLSGDRQIVCITHLPQIASLAERHFRIEKATAAGSAITEVSELTGDAIVSELVRMLGASDGDRAASQHARSLLKAA